MRKQVVVRQSTCKVLPERCWECPDRDGDVCDVLVRRNIVDGDVRISEAIREIREGTGRPAWCPLVEVECG